MPVRTIRKGASKRAKQKHASKTIRELHTGSTYAHTARKFGKKRAQKQAVAIAMKAARIRRRKKR